MKTMPSIAKLQSPYMSPDSIRNFLAFQKKFYESFTKENYGTHDVYGSKYSGIFKNFGSEILIESHKLLCEKIPLDSLVTQDSFNKYFKLRYSDFINTYEQQNLIACVLKEDLFIDDNTTIEFTDCEICRIIRSKSSSDPDAIPTEWIRTTSEPTMITDTSDFKIGLLPGDDSGVTYYFPITNSSSTSTFVDLIESYDDVNNILTIGNLSKANSGRPFFMVCLDSMKSLPDVDFDGNIDQYDRPLLTFGTDGHDVTHLYPLMYGTDNVPEYELDAGKRWFLKVISPSGFFQGVDENESAKLNRNIPISEIHYIYSENPYTEGTYSQTITFDMTYTHVSLANPGMWTYRKPLPGEYDYDGRSYINKPYAYILLTQFNQNSGEEPPLPDTGTLIPAFNMSFDDAFIANLEENCVRGYSGINIDASSDLAENNVRKINGNIHDLGAFGYTKESTLNAGSLYNGLPSYYRYPSSREIHRHHVEIYSIRDGLDTVKLPTTKKQTAGIIVDSGKPKNVVDKNVPKGENAIVYIGNSVFNTVGVPISKSNYLTDILYVSDELFDISERKTPRFVYHGKSYFSLGIAELDPDNEYGRVYCISNDGQAYENNAVTNSKAPRTLARICDLPTSFVHLTGNTGIAPTYIIDEKYVRSGAQLTITGKRDRLWNTLGYVVTGYDHTFIYEYSDDLDTILDTVTLLEDGYSKITNVGTVLDLNLADTLGITYIVIDGGTDYEVGDEFVSVVCGKKLIGTVTAATASEVTAVTFDIESDSYFPLSNLDIMARSGDDPYDAKLKTTTLTGDGDGLVVAISIPYNTWWALVEKPYVTQFKPLITFKREENGNIYIYRRYDTPVENVRWREKHIMIGDEEGFSHEKTNVPIALLANGIFDKSDMSESRFKAFGSTYNIELEMEAADFNETVDYTVTDESIRSLMTQDTYMFITYDTDPPEDVEVVMCESCVCNLSSELTPGNIDGVQHEKLLPHKFDFTRFQDASNEFTRIEDGSSQVSVAIFDYTISMFDTTAKVSKDIVRVTESEPMSLYKIHQLFASRYNRPLLNMSSNRGSLIHKLYMYDMTYARSLDELRNRLAAMTREAVVEDTRYYNPGCELLAFEGTSSQYSKDEYIHYRLQSFCVKDLRYHRDGITGIGNKDEEVCEKRENNQYYPLDDKYRPKGRYNSITTIKDSGDTIIKNTPYETHIEFVFVVEGLIDFTSEIKMVDADGIDVSSRSLVINKYKNDEDIYVYDKYIYGNRGWTIIHS